MENIIKPASIIYEEFKNDLKELINNSSLPAFMLEPVIRDVYNKVKIAEQQQLERDRQHYQEMLDNSQAE